MLAPIPSTMYNSIGKNLILNPYNIVLPDDTRLFEADRKSDLVRSVAGNDSKVIIAVVVVFERSGRGGDSNEVGRGVANS